MPMAAIHSATVAYAWRQRAMKVHTRAQETQPLPPDAGRRMG